jgi:methylmalonyl-CoA mutase cobalamin-binding domain/chain
VTSTTGADGIRDEFTRALEKGDANLAELIALDAIAEEGLSVADLYVDVIGPALATIGHRWETGAMSIADEHLATGISLDVMRLVGRTATRHPRRSRERLLLAAVGTEGHVTGLRMIADLAEGSGFDVLFLGAAVPVESVADVVAKHTPEIVGLSVTMAAPGRQVTAALDEVVRSGHAPQGILVGGRGVTDELRQDPRVRYAPDAREAMRVIEQLAAPPLS